MVEYDDDDDWVVDHTEALLEEYYASLLDEDDRVAVSEKCASCRYDLRGVHIDGCCPECGVPVRHSIWLPDRDADEVRIRFSRARTLATTILIGVLARVDLVLGWMLLALAVLIWRFHMPLELGLGALKEGSSLFPVLGPAIVVCLALHLAVMLALPVVLRPGLFWFLIRWFAGLHTLLHGLGAGALVFAVVMGFVVQSPEALDYLMTVALSILNVTLLIGAFTIIVLISIGFERPDVEENDCGCPIIQDGDSRAMKLFREMIKIGFYIVLATSVIGVITSVVVGIRQVWTGGVGHDPIAHLRGTLALYALLCGIVLPFWASLHASELQMCWRALRRSENSPSQQAAPREP